MTMRAIAQIAGVSMMLTVIFATMCFFTEGLPLIIFFTLTLIFLTITVAFDLEWWKRYGAGRNE